MCRGRYAGKAVARQECEQSADEGAGEEARDEEAFAIGDAFGRRGWDEDAGIRPGGLQALGEFGGHGLEAMAVAIDEEYVGVAFG